MRRAAAIDANQPKIVEQLRRCGFSVLHLHTIGQGCPDIAVGAKGKNFLFEIKDPENIPSKRQLTPDEVLFQQRWRGQYHVIETIDDALRVIDEK